jgi:hypothetical protein
VVIENKFHRNQPQMTYLYRSDWADAELNNPPMDQHVSIVQKEGRSTVRIDLPQAGMAILA